MLAKCVFTILELNCNQRFKGKKVKLNICHHMLATLTKPQNRSFHIVEITRMSAKCTKMKTSRANLLFFIVKCTNLPRSCCR